MPRTKSAKKALKRSQRRWLINEQRRRKIKIVVKKYLDLIKAKKIEEAQKVLSEVYKEIDKAAKTFMHKNKAVRLKSRYASLLAE